MFRIPGFHCCGPGSLPGWGIENPANHEAQPKEKKKTLQVSFFHLPWVKELTGTIQDKGAPWSGVWFLGTHHVRELVCLLSLCDRMEGAEL